MSLVLRPRIKYGAGGKCGKIPLMKENVEYINRIEQDFSSVQI